MLLDPDMYDVEAIDDFFSSISNDLRKQVSQHK